MAHKNRYWDYYKLFRDPPGTPEELRCVGCKLVAAGAATTIGLATCYGMARTIKNNVFIGLGFGFATFMSFSAAGIASRMAYTDHNYNEWLTKENYKKLRLERQANRDKSIQNVS